MRQACFNPSAFSHNDQLILKKYGLGPFRVDREEDGDIFIVINPDRGRSGHIGFKSELLIITEVPDRVADAVA